MSAIRTCLQVTEQQIRAALAPARAFDEPTPRSRIFALLEHLSRIARPSAGAPKILIVAAHVGTCDWLDGELIVRLRRDGAGTRFELLVDGGLNAERVLGPLSIQAPIEEFQNAVRARPDMVQPLMAQGKREADRLVLRTTSLLRRTTAPPLFSAIADDLLIGLGARSLESPRVPSGLMDAVPASAPAREPPRRPPPVAVPLPPHLARALDKLKKKQPEVTVAGATDDIDDDWG